MNKWLAGAGVAVLALAVAAGVAAAVGSGSRASGCVGAEPPGAWKTYRVQAGDGNCLQGYVWSPAGEVRAVLVVVHGLHDHARRYEGLARAMNEAGIAVLAQDHRGHGGSGGPRQRLDSVAQAIGDVDLAIGEAQRRFAGRPLVLHGHSLGGMVVAQRVARQPAGLAGAVLSSAALKLPANVTDGQRKVVGALSTLAPELGIDAVDEAQVVRAPEARKALAADPTIERAKLPARTVATLLDGVVDLQPRLAGIGVPLLILHGDADRITDPAGSQALHAAARSPSKTLRRVPAALHDLMHEPEAPELMREIAAFVLR